MDQLEVFREAVSNGQRIIAGFRPDAWGRPTVCTEFDVRALVNHYIGGQQFIAAVADGSQEPPPGGADFSEDAGTHVRRVGDEIVAAFSRADALDRQYQLGIATVPGPQALFIATLESVVHGWDLATATDQPHGVPDEIAEWMLIFVRHMPSRFRGDGPGVPFQQPVPIDEDAPPVDRLMAFLGRRPDAGHR